jgi:hypothetical protein
MMTNSNQTTSTLDQEIDQLRTVVRQNWIDSAVSINTFANKRSLAELTAWLNDKKLKVTEKANKFTAAAKIALAEEVDGVWVVSDAQASRYSKVCIHLEAHGVATANAASFLAGMTMTSILRPKEANGPDKTEAERRFQLGLACLEEEFGTGDIVTYDQDKFYVCAKSGLTPGVNLAVVVIGANREVQSIARAPENSDAVQIAVRQYAPKN